MPGRYVSATTREKISRPVAEMETIKGDPYLYRNVPNKDQFDKNYEKRKAVLDSVTPPTITQPEKTKLQNRADRLAVAMVKGNPDYVPPMPDDEQMQRPRAGSVDQHMRWESFWKRHTLGSKDEIVAVKPGARGAIFEWKDIQRIIHRDHEQEAPNAANLEMLRPAGGPPSLADTHLPVSYGFSSTAKRHYDEVFADHKPTHVERKIKRGKSEEFREAARQRMKTYWENKRAKAKEAVPAE